MMQNLQFVLLNQSISLACVLCEDQCVDSCAMCFGKTLNSNGTCVHQKLNSVVQVWFPYNPFNQKNSIKQIQVKEFGVDFATFIINEQEFQCMGISCLRCPSGYQFDKTSKVCHAIEQDIKKNQVYLKSLGDEYQLSCNYNAPFYCEKTQQCVTNCVQDCNVNAFMYCGMTCAVTCLNCSSGPYVSYQMDYFCQDKCASDTVYEIDLYKQFGYYCGEVDNCSSESKFEAEINKTVISCPSEASQLQCPIDQSNGYLMTYVDKCADCAGRSVNNGGFCDQGCLYYFFDGQKCSKICPESKYWCNSKQYCSCTLDCEEQWIQDSGGMLYCGVCSQVQQKTYLNRSNGYCLLSCEYQNVSYQGQMLNGTHNTIYCEDPSDEENCPVKADNGDGTSTCIKECSITAAEEQYHNANMMIFVNRSNKHCLTHCQYLNATHNNFYCEDPTNETFCPVARKNDGSTYTCMTECREDQPYIQKIDNNGIIMRICMERCEDPFTEIGSKICTTTCEKGIFGLVENEVTQEVDESFQATCLDACEATLYNSSTYVDLLNKHNITIPNLPDGHLFCYETVKIDMTKENMFWAFLAGVALEFIYTFQTYRVMQKVEVFKKQWKLMLFLILVACKLILVVICWGLSWSISKDEAPSSYNTALLVFAILELIFMISCALISTRKHKGEETHFNKKFYSAHLGTTVFTFANTFISFLFFFCDAFEFFTYYKPAFSVKGQPIFYIPDKMLEAAISLATKQASVYFLIIIVAVQVLTDYDNPFIKAVRKIVEDNENDPIKKHRINEETFYLKFAIYCVVILICFTMIVLAQYFTNLFEQQPLLGVFIIPPLFMLSTYRIVGYIKYRVFISWQTSKAGYGMFHNVIQKILNFKSKDSKIPLCTLVANLILNLGKLLLLIIIATFYIAYSGIMIAFNVAISAVLVYVHFTQLIFYPFQFVTTLIGINNQKFRDATINYSFSNFLSVALSFLVSSLLYLIPLLIISLPAEAEGSSGFNFQIMMIIYAATIILSAIAHITEYWVIRKLDPDDKKEPVYQLPVTTKSDTEVRADFNSMHKDKSEIKKDKESSKESSSESRSEEEEPKYSHPYRAENWLIDFQQEPEYIGAYYQALQCVAYSFIPYIGILLCDLAAMLNLPPLTFRGGKTIVQARYFFNIIEYLSYILTAYFYTGGSSNTAQKNNIYILFFVLTVIFAVEDSVLEGSHIIPPENRMSTFDLMFGCCMYKNMVIEVENKQIQMRRSIRNVEGKQQDVKHKHSERHQQHGEQKGEEHTVKHLIELPNVK